ncbi:MAG TPA: YceI family protein [Puia sp.]|nr:YceI family protein [Puia sp.]
MRFLLSAWILLSGFCLRAQDFVTSDGLVSFFGEKPFESVRADNHEVKGVIDIETGQVEFHTLVKSFRFRNKTIERAFDDKYMESEKYPKMDFVGKIIDLSGIDFNKPGVYPIVVEGQFTIHNVARPVSHPGTLTVSENGLIAKSQFSVQPDGFKVNVPRLFGRRLVKEINVSVVMNFVAEKAKEK